LESVLASADISEKAIENPGEAALIIDPRNRILYCTRFFSQMIHQPGHDLIGSPFGNFLVPRDRNRFCRLLEKAGKNRAGGEFSLLTSAGRLRVHLSIRMLPGNGIKTYGILATGTVPRGLASAVQQQAPGPIIVCDEKGRVIWANRAASRAGLNTRSSRLPRSEHEARNLLDQAEVGVCVVSRDGRIRETNRRWTAIFGRDFVNLPGRAGPEIDRASTWDPDAGQRQTRPTVQEISTTHTDGTPLTVELRRKDLPEGDTLFLARDITQRRILEREVLAINHREERRIGRNLHDELAQSLAGIGFLTKVLEQKLRGQGMEESQDARRVGELVREAVRQARKLAHGLCPVEFAPDGLNTALGELCSSLANHLQVPCRFEVSGHLPLPSDTAVDELYLIARELATSAVTNGGAGWVAVRLDNDGRKSVLTLEHNGNPNPASDRKAIDIARYRASVIGARLSFMRKEDGSTVIHCTWRDS
jgi:PAS domain S-box-containing protein